MGFYGYHRTSTREQHLDRGLAEIERYCADNHIKLEKIFTDQQTGKNFNRPRYQVMKEDVLRKGDTLIVTELDRLGRDKKETMKEIQFFREHDIRLMVLELPTSLMDVSAMENSMAQMMLECIGNMMLELYASMAQAELEKKEKRQREGIEQKKRRGEWDDYGRPRALPFDDFQREYEQVLSGMIRPFELIRKLNLSKPTYYRYKAQYEAEVGININN